MKPAGILPWLILLSALIPCVQADDKPSDQRRDFHVQPARETRPFPEPLPSGEQPGFKFRGTKGWAWTPEQYLAEIPFLAKFKMNFLMNCYLSMFDLEHHPDPLDGARANRWWEPLPAKKKAAYEKVVRACRKQGIQFCFSMNPGLDSARMVHDDSPQSVEQLFQHYAWMQALGVKWFNISLDDITSGINARDQAKVVNTIFHRLRAADPDARMIFCPTCYWGDGNGADQRPYLEILARDLDKDVYLFWTGDFVYGPVTRHAAESFRRICGHRLFLWDNYPVNDNQPTLHLGPVVDRDPDLCEVIDGYMSNPHCKQNQINRIPLATCADYAYNPSAYDPARSISQAIALLAGSPAQRDALRDLVETYPGMLIYSRHDSGFNSVQEQFNRIIQTPNSRQAALGYIEHLRNLSGRLKKAFPGRYQPAIQTLDDNTETAARELAKKYP